MRGEAGLKGFSGQQGEPGGYGQIGPKGAPGVKGQKGKPALLLALKINSTMSLRPVLTSLLPGDRGLSGQPGEKPHISPQIIVHMKGKKGEPGQQGYQGFPGPRGGWSLSVAT